MENLIYTISYVLSTIFQLYVISKFMIMFLDRGKTNKWITCCTYILQFAVGAIQYKVAPNIIVNIGVGLITIFIISLCYGGTILNKVISVMLIYLCLFGAELIGTGMLEITGTRISMDGQNGDALSCIVVAIMLWIIYEIIRMFKVSDTQFKMPKIFSGIIILLSVAAITLEMVIFLYGNVPELVKIVSVMCMLVILFLIIFMYDILNDYYNEKIRLELLEKEKNYYLNQAELATEHVNEIRKFKHDIKNHLLALDAIIQNDRKGAKEYITELEDRVSSEELYSESGNVAVDSVINYKLSNATNKNIKVSSKIVIPEQFSIDTKDIITIIGNLLDNAIEAADKTDGRKYVNIHMELKMGNLFIEVSNSYNGKIKQEDGKFITDKTDKKIHGIGITNIKDTLKKYESNIDFSYTEKDFCVKVIMCKK